MKEMTFMEHLEELRTRIIRVLIILVVSFGICYYFSTDIQEFLLAPLRAAIGTQGKVVFTGLLDKVLAELQIAFWSCVALASPFWFREAWLFIKPGLYESEVRAIRPFIFVGFLLFIAGVAFGYYVIFPFTFKTLISSGVQNVEAMLNLQDYLLLSSKVLVFLGILFQMPNVIIILGFMGLVTKYSLRNMRRYLAVAFAVAAAVITPTPDILSMMCVWIPMMILYEIGIIAVAWIVHPYLHRKYMSDETTSESEPEEEA
ncbi:twin-arginine translocase subunit TatC [Peredibacter starrii]|uniref:Sec-independent protein translocase protein TatC n=1 Tax=Peredibacter starrii TaxID=28202 RepID=A0AAX4HSN1_9BACT|nr:twin-arginine translocase subunit TatC [Peredibacter starrii]WPU66200.1 twin-arginine translocase subunit TatC [Peredibacter starrii]